MALMRSGVRVGVGGGVRVRVLGLGCSWWVSPVACCEHSGWCSSRTRPCGAASSRSLRTWSGLGLGLGFEELAHLVRVRVGARV
eukprot:scaffold20570_cov32-Phaeocystis_antarctica.AAC.2